MKAKIYMLGMILSFFCLKMGTEKLLTIQEEFRAFAVAFMTFTTAGVIALMIIEKYKKDK